MIKQQWIVGLLLLLLNCKIQAVAATLVLDDSKSDYNLNLHSEWFEDPEKTLSLSEVLALPEHAFKTGLGENPNLGYTASALWLRFTLKNNSSQSIWFLEMAYPRIDAMQLYMLQANGSYRKLRNDVLLPFNQRPIPHHNFIFSLELDQGMEKTYYLRIAQTHNMMVLPLSLRTMPSTIDKIKDEYYGLGLYYGALLIMLLYNLCIYVALRKKTYLHYVLFLFSLGFLQISNNHISLEYFWPNYPRLQYVSTLLAASMLIFTAAQFTRSFINLGSYAPKLDRILASYLCLAPICGLAPLSLSTTMQFFSWQGSLWIIPLSFSGLVGIWYWLRHTDPYIRQAPNDLPFILIAGGLWYLALYWIQAQYIRALYNGLSVSLVGVIIVAIVIGCQQRNRAAFYMLYAWGLFLICVLLNLGLGLGLLSANIITLNGWMLGSFVAIMFLAFGLADDFRAERMAKEQAQNQAIENLQQSNKIKDSIFSNTTHELRTPLSIILGLIGQVTADTRLATEHQKHLQLATASGRKLDNLINDILDASQLEHRQLSLNLRPLQVHRVLQHMLDVFQPAAMEKGIALINHCAPQTAAVMADESRLYQILYNLIGNAVKFTNNGSVTLRTYSKGDMVYISITDTGIGIESAQLQRIFEPFEQGDASITRCFGGTGLGLSVTQQLLALHQGTVSVDSTLGHGSCFTLGLPRAPENLSIVKAKPPTGSPPDLAMPDGNLVKPASLQQQPFDLLIVDDDEMHRYLIQTQLGNSSYNIRQAANVNEASKQLQQRLPDLILLDVMMPDISGFAYCRKLRQQYSKTLLPIIFITAKQQSSDLTEGFACGANDYIVKPFSQEEILLRVSHHLQLLLSNRRLQSLQTLANRITLSTDKTELLKTVLTITHQHSYAQASVLLYQGQPIQGYPDKTVWSLPVGNIDKIFADADDKSTDENYCQILVHNNLSSSHPLNCYNRTQTESHLLLWRIQGLDNYRILLRRQYDLPVFDTNDITYLQHIARQITTQLDSPQKASSKPHIIEAINSILQHKNALVYVEADTPYCHVYLDDGRKLPLLRIGMNKLNQYFDNKQLLRIHRSYLVNPKCIHSIEKHNRDLKLKVMHGQKTVTLPVGRNYMASVNKLGIMHKKP